MRRIFSTVFGPQEPAWTAGWLAISATGRPPTVPIPVTTPSAPRPSCSQLASRPSSASEPGSRSLATRSRTGSFCCSATFLRCLSGPPSSAASSAALPSLTGTSGSEVRFLLGLGLLQLRLVVELRGLAPRLGPVLSGKWIELVGLGEEVLVAWPVLGSSRRQLAAELLRIRQHVVAAANQVGDHRLDALAPLRSLLHDPAGLRMRGGDRLPGVLLGLPPRAGGLLLRLRTSLLRIGVRRGPGLVRVRIGVVAGLLGLHVRGIDVAASLLIGLGTDLLGALLGLSEDRPRSLPDPLELALDRVRARLVTGARLEPVRQAGEE